MSKTPERLSFFQIHYGWAASDRKSLCQGLTWMFRGKLRLRKSPVFSGRTWYPLQWWCSQYCKDWPWQGSVWGYHRWWLAAEPRPAGGGELGGQQRELVSHRQNCALCSPRVAVNACTSRDTWVCLYLQSCTNPCRMRAMSWDSVKSPKYLHVGLKFVGFCSLFESWSIFLKIQIYSIGSSNARESWICTLPSSTAGCSWSALWYSRQKAECISVKSVSFHIPAVWKRFLST